MLSGSATIASSQSFSMIQRRMLLSPCPASPVNSDEPLCTSAMRLPSGVSRFILLSMLTRNISCPSLERVIRLNSGSPAWLMMKRESFKPSFPPIRSRSVFQLFPYGGFESMKSNSRVGNASWDRVEAWTKFSASSPSPLSSRSALLIAYVSALTSCPKR